MWKRVFGTQIETICYEMDGPMYLNATSFTYSFQLFQRPCIGLHNMIHFSKKPYEKQNVRKRYKNFFVFFV